jgi:hypothetical protein
MPWGANEGEFSADLAQAKPHPGTLLITGELAETESHEQVRRGALYAVLAGGCHMGGGCMRSNLLLRW